MTTTVNKIIAKEILLFLICFCMAFISFLGLGLDNYFKIKNLNAKKELSYKYSDSSYRLSKVFQTKEYLQRILFDNVNSNFNLQTWDTPQKFWNRTISLAKSDSLRQILIQRPEFEKSLYKTLEVDSYEQLIIALEKNKITVQDSLDEKKSENLNIVNGRLTESIKTMQHTIWDTDTQKNIVLQVFLYSVVVLFVLRYLIILFKWCINTLRIKSE